MGNRKFETLSVFVGNFTISVVPVIICTSLERIKIVICSQHLFCTVGAVTTVYPHSLFAES